MSDEIAVSLQNAGKMYKLYPSRLDMALDATGLIHLFPWRKTVASEFWALRNIQLEIYKGERLGIIGRNGAGKSTLLKLLTGNLALTEGRLSVNGTVQALLTSGAGFHPEFTGYENIRSSLVYQGLTSDQIDRAIEDITEFTELGDFLSQPFKVYSAGMQARLAFATATVLNPDILIVDEILGAGDAYFAGKSLNRMKKLVEDSGATVLIVSHALDQILQYCDQCVWMERGKIVQRGSALDVVKAYQEFIHALEDQRLKAKNRQRLTGGNASNLSDSSELLTVTFQVQGEPGAACDIAEVSLLRDGKVEETLHVGDVQDTSPGHRAYVSMVDSNWSVPQRADEDFFRSLKLKEAGSLAQGTLNFFVFRFYEEAEYSLRVRYRTGPVAPSVLISVARNRIQVQEPANLPSANADWAEWQLSLSYVHKTQPAIKIGSVHEVPAANLQSEGKPRAITRWASDGSVVIDKVRLLGANGHEQAVFTPGSSLILSVTIKACIKGNYDIVLTAPLFRLDGILVTKFRTSLIPMKLEQDEKKEFQLELAPLNLGDGNYIFSLGLFDKLIEEQNRLDLVDRSFEFQVAGNDTFFNQAIFRHDGSWRLT